MRTNTKISMWIHLEKVQTRDGPIPIPMHRFGRLWHESASNRFADREQKFADYFLRVFI